MNYKILFTLLFVANSLWSQNYKFGKVSIEELKEKSYSKDSVAPAVILYSGRKTTFDYAEDTGFVINTEYHKRIKIYTKEGFDEATLEHFLYFDVASNKEDMLFVKAITYNLENGKIVKTKLKNSDIYNERLNRYYFSKKFTMPNLKEGCIVEWKYTLKTPFWSRLREIEVQKNIPVKKHKTIIKIPEYLIYKIIPKGYLSIPINKEKRDRTISFLVHQNHNNILQKTTKTERVSTRFLETIYNIEMSDIPAIIDEPYSGNINNYKAGLVFELSYTRFPNSAHSYTSSWEAITKDISHSTFFGDQLKKNKHFIDDLPNIIKDKSSEIDKMYAIFNFIKTKIKWNNFQGYYTDLGTKKAYKEGLGNTADINLNLIAMLREAGIESDPVLVSTVDNGIPLLPTRSGFNYVIAWVKIGDKKFLLDATDKLHIPNILPEKVLNFRGRLILSKKESKWIDLYPKNHSIKKTIISTKFDGTSFSGNTRTIFTNHYALRYRTEVIKKSNEELVEYLDETQKDIDVLNVRVGNLESLEKDVIETIKFQSDSFYEEINGKIYITPYLYTQITDNPFKSQERKFPVFYNIPWANISTINLTIPDGYIVESIPENIEYHLLNDVGHYQSAIVQQGNQLKVTTAFVINEPVISYNNYQELKEFYKKVIINQAEKIILIKE